MQRRPSPFTARHALTEHDDGRHPHLLILASHSRYGAFWRTVKQNNMETPPLTTLSNGTRPWVSNPTAQKILVYLQIANPIILLFFFLIAFTVRSIVTVANDNDTTPDNERTGPGGKPLPKKTAKKPNDTSAFDFSRPRKLLFQWLSLGTTLSFVANIITVIVHTLYARNDQWWCGQATTVRLRS